MLQPLPTPEVPPQTIPELYVLLAAEFDHCFGALKKGLREIRAELPNVKPRRDQEQTLAPVDLQRRVDRLQREVSIIAKISWLIVARAARPRSTGEPPVVRV